jgi:hypothetical protein
MCPGPDPFPVLCCAMAPCAGAVGTEATALVHTPATGGEAVTVAATLPPPSTFGDFNIYLATVIIPETDGGPGDVLFPTPEDPPTYATTIDIPTAARLTPRSRVIIEPFKEGPGISGPVILKPSWASAGNKKPRGLNPTRFFLYRNNFIRLIQFFVNGIHI